MKADKFKNMSDRDLEVIIKAQAHHPRYLEAVTEYATRQEVNKKKQKKMHRYNLYLTILIVFLTFLLAYFTVGVLHYSFPVPFGGHP